MALVPIRLVIALLGIYACGLVYVQRAGMSVAIVAMTTGKVVPIGKNFEKNLSSKSIEQTSIEQSLSNNFSIFDDIEQRSSSLVHRVVAECATQDSKNLSKKNNDNEFRENPEFDWSATLQGIILGSSYYLYIFVPTLAGRATDAIGGKWIAFTGTLFPCALAAITPVVVRHFDYGGLIAIRTVMGGFHGFIYAAIFSLYVQWFPPKERAMANAGMVFGGSLGSTVMNALAGYLCDTEYGWPLVFYVTALFHVPWLFAWFWFVTNDPKKNLRISDSELKYLTKSVPPSVKSKNVSAPWRRIFTSPIVWCVMITKMCAGFGYFLLQTKMPAYLSSVFGISILQNGLANAATTMGTGVMALLAAPLSNWIIKRYQLRSIWVRKVFQSVAMIGPAICIGLIPMMGCESIAVICLLIGSMLSYGCFAGGEWTTISEFAPNFAGTIFGIGNILAFVMAVVAPYLVGVLLDSNSAHSRSQWNIVFYITAAVYLAGAIDYILFGTDQQQDWDKIQDPTPIQIGEEDEEIGDNISSCSSSSSDNSSIHRHQQQHPDNGHILMVKSSR